MTDTDTVTIDDINVWYVLKRVTMQANRNLLIEYLLVPVSGDNDPMHGYGSWDYFSGPHATMGQAKNSVPEEF